MDTRTKLNEIHLFAGGGGGVLASQYLKQWRTVCYVEWANYPQNILEARIADGSIQNAPIWDDVATFDGMPWRGYVDIVSGGFPCQPFSVAGKKKAGDDLRNGWPHFARIIGEVSPQYVWAENVPGLLSAMDNSKSVPVGYFGTVLGDLAQMGYDAKWGCVSAKEAGAPHKRDRLWIWATKSVGNTQYDGHTSP